MKPWIIGGLAALLIASSGASRAADNDRNTGKTVEHASKGIGHGVGRLGHEMSRAYHKTVAHNTHDPHRRAYHLNRAASHRRHARLEAHLSRKELKESHDASKR